MNAAVHGVVARFNGSIAAEHGVGRLKRDLLTGVKSEVELDLMRTLEKRVRSGRSAQSGRASAAALTLRQA